MGYLPVYDVLPFKIAGLPYAGTVSDTRTNIPPDIKDR